MRLISGLLIVLLLMSGMFYLYFNEAQTKKRAAQASLDRLSEAVESQDTKQVRAALETLLSDDATIRLEIYFFSIGNNRPMKEQDFTKAEFIHFIDTIIYSLDSYSYTAWMKEVDASTNHVTFSSLEWADGTNMMGGISTDMRYGSDTLCEGIADFDTEPARLKHVTCKLKFQQVPKAENATDLMEQIKHLP